MGGDRELTDGEARTVSSREATATLRISGRGKPRSARAGVMLVIGLIAGGLLVQCSAAGAATGAPTNAPSNGLPTGATASPSGSGLFPAQVEGKPVYFGNDILKQVADASDDAPFFIGGFVSEFPTSIDCAPETAPPGIDTRFLRACSREAPYLGSTDDVGISMSLSHPAVPDLGNLGDLVVIRVHVRDKASVTCPSDWQATCRKMIFLDAVVWRRSTPG